MRIVLKSMALWKWRLSKLDINCAFPHTFKAERDVYLLPPFESSARVRFVWLVITASYGRINYKANWDWLSDTPLTGIGFKRMNINSILRSRVLSFTSLVLPSYFARTTPRAALSSERLRAHTHPRLRFRSSIVLLHYPAPSLSVNRAGAQELHPNTLFVLHLLLR